MALSRRKLILGASAAALAPRVAWADASERLYPRSLAVGDVGPNGATFWAHGRRPGRMVIQLADNPDFQSAREVLGPTANEASDFCGKLRLDDLPRASTVHWRASFDLDGDRGEWMVGAFRTAGSGRDIRFAWGGDTGGQGFGINDDFGGMRIFDAIRQSKPDFLVHCGDLVYSDSVYQDRKECHDGSTWNNLVTGATGKVAQTLEEFRGRFRYNHIDDNFRALLTEVPVFHMWDDHEVKNNWYHGAPVKDPRYEVHNVDPLIARARRAFFEYTPIIGQRVYRKVSYGPLLDVFMLDTRSYRAPNSTGKQKCYGPGAEWLGLGQRDWLKRELCASKATWKVICNDMPLGILTRGEDKVTDNATNGNGEARGREIEIAQILLHLKQHGVKNTVWLTADLHYATATHYSPERAQFRDFDPFWEFMAGPFNAGTGKLHELDDTFGPRNEWASIDADLERGMPPSMGLQFFGIVEIHHQSLDMTVSFYDQAGKKLFAQSLGAKGA